MSGTGVRDSARRKTFSVSERNAPTIELAVEHAERIGISFSELVARSLERELRRVWREAERRKGVSR